MLFEFHYSFILQIKNNNKDKFFLDLDSKVKNCTNNYRSNLSQEGLEKLFIRILLKQSTRLHIQPYNLYLYTKRIPHYNRFSLYTNFFRFYYYLVYLILLV